MAMNNLFLLGNLKKLLANLVNPKSQLDNVKFALCYALINFTYKLVLCLMRRLQTSDKVNSLVGAACASVWIAMEPANRRSLI